MQRKKNKHHNGTGQVHINNPHDDNNGHCHNNNGRCHESSCVADTTSGCDPFWTVLCVGCGTGMHEFLIRTVLDKLAKERKDPLLKFVFTERGTADRHYPGYSLPFVLPMDATEAIRQFGADDTVVMAFRPTPRRKQPGQAARPLSFLGRSQMAV